MNEHKQVAQFNDDVDKLLTGHEPLGRSQADDELLTIARTLANTDLSGESQRLHTTIRQHLLDMAANRDPEQLRPAKMVRRNHPLRVLMASAAALVVMTTAVFTIPPLRALAQDILGQIGIFQFTNEQTFAQQIVGQTITPAPTTPMTVSNRVTRWNVEQASELAGFPVYEPSYLPPDYNFSTRRVDSNERGIFVNSEFTKRTYDGNINNADALTLIQILPTTTQDIREWAVGDAQLVDVVVDGNVGLWIEDTPNGWTTDENGNRQTFGVNMLVWEKDGYTFWMTSWQLSQDEMISIGNVVFPRYIADQFTWSPQDDLVSFPTSVPLSIEEVSEITGLQVLVPSFMPSGYIFERADYNRGQNTASLHYTYTGDGCVDEVDNDVCKITIHESSSIGGAAISQNALVTQTRVGVYEAAYVRGAWNWVEGTRYTQDGQTFGDIAWDDDAPYQWLYWQQDGTWIQMIAKGASPDEPGYVGQEDMLRIGNLLITNAPTYAEIVRDGLPTPTSIPNLTPVSEPFQPLTYEELAARVNFPIYVASYIPDGIEFCCYTGNFNGTPDSAIASYQGNYLNFQGEFSPFPLIISQTIQTSENATDEFPIGDAPVEGVLVNGIEGIFIEQSLQGISTIAGWRTVYTTANLLFWEQDDFVFRIASDALSKAEMLRIADSLAPADDETLTSTPTSTLIPNSSQKESIRCSRMKRLPLNLTTPFTSLITYHPHTSFAVTAVPTSAKILP